MAFLHVFSVSWATIESNSCTVAPVFPHQGGSWHQLPVPRGLRRSCMEQPTESFAPAGAMIKNSPENRFSDCF